jgi:GT2 family glycosyltransferase
MGFSIVEEDWCSDSGRTSKTIHMKIGYVCTNFNNSLFTLKAVETLFSNPGYAYEVVVVDNNSGEDDVALLKRLNERWPKVEIIYCDSNLGYFRGLNVGIQALRERHRDVEWIIVGNNDLEFPTDFSAKLAHALPRLRECPVVSPDVVTVEGEHQNPHVISSISPMREIFYDLYYSNYLVGLLIQRLARLFPGLSERRDEEQWRIARFIYQGHGSCYLLGPRFFEVFRDLWAPTFLMSEEFFLSKQLSDKGFKVYYEPAITVIHHWHGSLAKVASRQRWGFAREAHREYRKYVRWF